MLDLTNITDQQVAIYLADVSANVKPNTDSWRILGFCNEAQKEYSFCETRTYPRPDHPDPKKRLSLVYLMVGILVSLRTTLENEQKAMAKLINRYPIEKELFDAKEPDIAKCITCAGMPQTKSHRIRQALDYVSGLDGGLEKLANLPAEEAQAILLEIPGFGPKAADCMLTIGLGIPSMVVDVNVFRVGSSLLGMHWAESPDYANNRHVNELKNRLDKVAGDDAFLCQIVHTYLLLYGKHNRIRGHNKTNCKLGIYCKACA
jgi:endonuclease III